MDKNYRKYGAALSVLLACASPSAFAADHSTATQNSAPTKSGAATENGAATKHGAATKNSAYTNNSDVMKTHPIAQTTIRPGQLRANKVIGAEVYDRNNVKIGSVGDIVLDRDGRVAAVVLDIGGFLGIGSRAVAVRFSDIETENSRLTLDMSKNQLENLATYHLEKRRTEAATAPLPGHGGKPDPGSSH